MTELQRQSFRQVPVYQRNGAPLRRSKARLHTLGDENYGVRSLSTKAADQRMWSALSTCEFIEVYKRFTLIDAESQEAFSERTILATDTNVSEILLRGFVIVMAAALGTYMIFTDWAVLSFPVFAFSLLQILKIKVQKQ